MTKNIRSIGGTFVAYLHLCHRKLWLHYHGLKMEHTSEAVSIGKLIGERTYRRRAQRWRELALEGIRIDHFDALAKRVREVKKSPKMEHVHIAQVKYYIYALELRGIADVHGILEYPKQRRTTKVVLEEGDREMIEGWEKKIEEIVSQPICPKLREKSICKNCAFFDFCFV